MIDLAIGVLWLLLGALILCGVIYLALRIVKVWFPGFDPRIEQAIWMIVGILVLIAALSLIAGRGRLVEGPPSSPFQAAWAAGRSAAALSARAAGHY